MTSLQLYSGLKLVGGVAPEGPDWQTTLADGTPIGAFHVAALRSRAKELWRLSVMIGDSAREPLCELISSDLPVDKEHKTFHRAVGCSESASTLTG